MQRLARRIENGVVVVDVVELPRISLEIEEFVKLGTVKGNVAVCARLELRVDNVP